MTSPSADVIDLCSSSNSVTRPTIQILAGGLAQEVTLAERALAVAGFSIHQGSGALVTRARLVDLLCRSARFMKVDGRSGRLRQIDPPAALVRTILARARGRSDSNDSI